MALATIRIHLLGRLPEALRLAFQNELERQPNVRAIVSQDEVEVLPDLVIVHVAHPDEMPSARLELLIRRWPGSRFLLLGGPWCEGVIRNRRIDVVVPWTTTDGFPSRLRMELDALSGRYEPLAITADRVEQFEREAKPSPASSAAALRVQVFSVDEDFRKWCGDALACGGFQVIDARLVPDGRSADVVLVDCDPLPSSGIPNAATEPELPVLFVSGTPWAVAVALPPDRYRVASRFATPAIWNELLRELAAGGASAKPNGPVLFR